MSKNIEHLQHIKSNVVNNGKPKLPTAEVLVEGELAVNYAEGYETISLRNSSSGITTFSSDDYYTKKKLGSGFTGVNSANTVTALLNEYVTLDTQQTINGAKSFGELVTLNDGLSAFGTSRLNGDTFVGEFASGAPVTSGSSSMRVNGTIESFGDLTVNGSVNANNANFNGSITSNGTIRANVGQFENSITTNGGITAANASLNGTLNLNNNDITNVNSITINGTARTYGELKTHTISPESGSTFNVGKSDKPYKTVFADNVRVGDIYISYDQESGGIETYKKDSSGATIDKALYYTSDYIDEIEEVASSALNDLNSNLNTHASDSSIHIKNGGEVIYKLENMSGEAGGTNLCASWSGDCDGITELYDGLNIQFKLPIAGHASGCTISINGGEQHRCILNASTSYTTQYPVGSIVRFVYDSNQSGSVYTGSSTPLSVQGVWKVSDYNTNTTYTVMPSTYLLNGKYKAYTNIYRYQILLSKDEEYLLPINVTSNSTASTKVLTTEEFDIFGPIYYYGSTATTNANAVIATGRTYISTSINLAYSFNTTTTLTPNKNVYMVVVPQTNNKAKLHSSPISQELPTTDDGLVYVLLGVAYSTSQIALEFRHPLYHFKNGKIREYTGANDSAYMDVDSELTPSSSTSNNLITANAVYDAVSGIEGQMEVISSALNDLNTNKADKLTTYTKSEIDDMIGDIETLLAAI